MRGLEDSFSLWSKGEDYRDATTQLLEAKCDHCGGRYLVDTVYSCPYCGAVLPPKEKTEQQG